MVISYCSRNEYITCLPVIGEDCVRKVQPKREYDRSKKRNLSPNNCYSNDPFRRRHSTTTNITNTEVCCGNPHFQHQLKQRTSVQNYLPFFCSVSSFLVTLLIAKWYFPGSHRLLLENCITRLTYLITSWIIGLHFFLTPWISASICRRRKRQYAFPSAVLSFRIVLFLAFLTQTGATSGIRLKNEIGNVLSPWITIEQYLSLNSQTMVPGIRDRCLPKVPKPSCDATKPACHRHVRHAHSKLDSSSAYPNTSRNDCASYLYGSHKECICHAPKGQHRLAILRRYKLYHCYHYNLWDVLDNAAKTGILENSDICMRFLSAVEALDATAGALTCELEEVMFRYDCSQTFSTRSSCDQCKAAYRLWTCSMFLPYWADTVRVKPCRSFCHQVERLCPYFLPADKTGPGSQYAGEPSYICIDNDVLETTSQAIVASYSPEGSCYRPCTLDYQLEPGTSPANCRNFEARECNDTVNSNLTCLPNELASSTSPVRWPSIGLLFWNIVFILR